jgi:hypothetical protein
MTEKTRTTADDQFYSMAYEKSGIVHGNPEVLNPSQRRFYWRYRHRGPDYAELVIDRLASWLEYYAPPQRHYHVKERPLSGNRVEVSTHMVVIHRREVTVRRVLSSVRFIVEPTHG